MHPTDPVDLGNFPMRMASPAGLMTMKRRGGKVGQEFRDFALKSSVLDMAIGIIMGVAFGKIIASFVDDITMPLIGYVFGKVDFSNLFFSLTGKHFDTLAAARSAGVPTLNYGLFLNAVFNFAIVAGSVFLLIRQVNRLHRQQANAVDVKECPFCRSGIHAAATRCPYCTAEQPQPKATAAPASGD
jgi:large conductance mechanosensitive channel